MSFSICFPAGDGHRLPYAQATSPQRGQALHYLRQRLHQHFPYLVEPSWTQALEVFQPDLVVVGAQVQLIEEDLVQLVQYLADSPELPVLQPPLYGPSALALAQQYLQVGALAVAALPELEALTPASSRRLHALVRRLARGSQLAEQVVQAWRWELVGGRVVPAGVAGGGPAPGSPEVEAHLQRLAGRYDYDPTSC